MLPFSWKCYFLSCLMFCFTVCCWQRWSDTCHNSFISYSLCWSHCTQKSCLREYLTNEEAKPRINMNGSMDVLHSIVLYICELCVEVTWDISSFHLVSGAVNNKLQQRILLLPLWLLVFFPCISFANVVWLLFLWNSVNFYYLGCKIRFSRWFIKL